MLGTGGHNLRLRQGGGGAVVLRRVEWVCYP
jgi:hypothetical protein